MVLPVSTTRTTTRTASRTFSSEDIDVCARLTGDLGAHHMGGLGDRRMAQGALTLSAVPLLAEPGVHMRDLSFAFLAPVYEGDTVTATLRATETAPGEPPAADGGLPASPALPAERALLACEISVVNAGGTPVLSGTGLAEVPRALADTLADTWAGTADSPTAEGS